MFKDTLKTKYKEFGSLGDTIIKSNELDIPIRLYTFLRAYNLLDEYRNLKTKPSKEERYTSNFVQAVRTIVHKIITNVYELGLNITYIPISESIPENTIKFICDITGLKYNITRNKMHYMIYSWSDVD